MTLFPQPLLDALAASARRPLIEHGDRTLTGGELLATTGSIVGGLRHAGLGPGRVVVLATELTPEGFAANLAVHALGCTVVAVRPAWSAPLLAAVLSGGIDAVVGDPTTLTPELMALAPVGTPVLSVGRHAGAADLLASPVAPIEVEARPDDIARLNFTSGSTGTPKGCARDYRTFTRAFLADGWAPDVARLVETMDRFLVHGDFSMPIAVTFTARCLLVGGTVVFGDHGPRPDLGRTIERHRASGVVMPPPLLQRLLHDDRNTPHDLRSLRALVLTGSPAPPALLAAATARLGRVVWQGYGQAESGMISLLTPDDIERHGADALASVGRMLPDVELSVRAGGELWVRSPHQMTGYWRDARETREVLRDGWLNTRDLGYVDRATGLLHLTARSRDVIMVNAEVCYAAAIERVLARQPGVDAAYVVGVPDERTGEAVHAFVVAVDERSLDTGALAAMVRAALSANHMPDTITVVEDVPTAAGGKPDKHALTELVLLRAGAKPP